MHGATALPCCGATTTPASDLHSFLSQQSRDAVSSHRLSAALSSGLRLGIRLLLSLARKIEEPARSAEIRLANYHVRRRPRSVCAIMISRSCNRRGILEKRLCSRSSPGRLLSESENSLQRSQDRDQIIITEPRRVIRYLSCEMDRGITEDSQAKCDRIHGAILFLRRSSLM